MPNPIRFFKQVRQLPNLVQLSYCLLRDPRVSPGYKAGALAAEVALVLPFIPTDFVPVVGDLEPIAATLLVAKTFISLCPDEIVRDHEEAISEGKSLWDKDLKCGEQKLNQLSKWLNSRRSNG